ncbi:hypothetical protein LCGC14_1287590 [marine sediment metagenome]|uniref:Uncharacterized protein n=1 Tax=marine sediment metagenome TaxID=412755 RepID=A0A0F9KTE9_9ZZZZ
MLRRQLLKSLLIAPFAFLRKKETNWNDPKKKLPKPMKMVFVKLDKPVEKNINRHFQEYSHGYGDNVYIGAIQREILTIFWDGKEIDRWIVFLESINQKRWFNIVYWDVSKDSVVGWKEIPTP